MTAGGACAALGLFIVGAGPSWPVEALAFAAMGCGFYMLHASIQVYVTEFAPATRSSAVAFHTFSFFIRGGISPILYGIRLDRLPAPRTRFRPPRSPGAVRALHAPHLVDAATTMCK